MTQQEILKTLTTVFRQRRVPYMLTGSIAVSFYGKPRYSHDVDVVIDVVADTSKNLGKALVSLSRQFQTFIDTSRLSELIDSARMISLLDRKSTLKIDLWILKRDEFAVGSFKRRKTKRVFGTLMDFISPEDLLLQKLMWYKDAHSDRHIEDAYTVYFGQLSRLDKKYLASWAKKLDVSALLVRIKTMSNPQN